jgi:uncharacterized protein (TIGR02246 family)
MTRHRPGLPHSSSIIFFGVIFFGLVSFSSVNLQAQTPAQQAITDLLTTQAAAWNRGDIETFMDCYEKSGDTAYIGAEPIKGYRAILARYRNRYPDRATMGHLTFSELDVRIVAQNVAIVVGRFALARAPAAGGPASGIFTLVARKTGTAWKIIHDHTS